MGSAGCGNLALRLRRGRQRSRLFVGPTTPGTPSQARPGTLQSCTDLASKAAFASTVYTSATSVPAGAFVVTGVSTPVPEHCLLQGQMNPRTSSVDGKSYAIGFEMRLPVAWNGRFFYQANGGLDGNVVRATGSTGGGAPTSTALHMGFAVISSDAGHSGAQIRPSASTRRRAWTMATTPLRS